MNKEQELANYLNKESFQRFVDAWIKKYKKLGYLGGSIRLENLSLSEKQDLGGLLGLDLTKGILSVSYSKLKKLLNYTYFENVNFLKVLELINGNKIITNKETKDSFKQQFELFKNQFLCLYQNTHVNVWLEDYFQNDKYVKRYYKENKNNYSQVLNHVCHALNKLPIYQNEYQLLAVFAQQITKDPHYFDEDLSKELLIKGICKILEVENSSINQILYEAGILKDDLSNYCYICHIKPKIIQDYDCFYEKYEPINLNLYNLNSIGRKFVKSKIVIIENPSVFRELMIEIKEKKLNIGLVCSNGQINQCTYQLIDSLIESQCILYYCGDFDPEGLLIADKLKQKYNSQINLWQYSAAHFEKAKIHQVVISQRRQTILKNIQNSLLKEIALKIQSTSAFAYQEGMIDIYKDNLANL